MDTDKYILNPATNRHVLRHGSIGRKLVLAKYAIGLPCIHTSTACEKCNACKTLALCEICTTVGPFAALKAHARTQHAPSSKARPKCTLGDACSIPRCKTPSLHVRLLEFHNQLVADPFSCDTVPDYQVSRLLVRPGPPPARAELLSEPRQCSDTGLPDDMWLHVFSFLGPEDKFALTKTCIKLRALVNSVVSPTERFLYNLQHMPISVYQDARMHATQAGQTYLLKDTDLIGLPIAFKRNQWRWFKLYNVADLERICIKVFRTWENFVAAKRTRATRAEISDQARRLRMQKQQEESRRLQEARDLRRAELEQALEAHGLTRSEYDAFVPYAYIQGGGLDAAVAEIRQCVARRTELQLALRAYGLPLRSDSHMCSSYIRRGRGVKGESMAEIVEIMREMHFLYSRTRYTNDIACIKNEYRRYGDWYEIDEVIDEAKTRAVGRWRRSNPHVDVTEIPPRIVARF